MQRVTLYTKSGCSSCQKAKQFLMRQGVHFTERDIFKHPFSEKELRAIIAHKPLDEIFSFRSPSVKALGLTDKALTAEEMLSHMLREPRLIRRPLLTAGESVVVGYSEPDLTAVLSN
ncbi:MAG TPA: Spx/MgsR family RNA polymerase-binding regulatory protein [Oscillatoriaceae cyanobacterium]